MSPYEETVLVNEKIVELAQEYRRTEDKKLHLEIFNLLLPTTTKTIAKVISSSGLPSHLAEDMLSEAFPRLHWAILYFRVEKTPVFIAYWKVCLKNELIRKYQPQWRHKELPKNYDHASPDTHTAYNLLLLKEIREYIQFLIKDWKKERQKELVMALLEERIFRLEPERTFQRDLAKRFEIQSGVISQWEIWVRKEITAKFSPEDIT